VQATDVSVLETQHFELESVYALLDSCAIDGCFCLRIWVVL
jgi:hypothetical protein